MHNRKYIKDSVKNIYDTYMYGENTEVSFSIAISLLISVVESAEIKDEVLEKSFEILNDYRDAKE